MILYLLRHGQTEANVTHTYCGITDMPLSPEGEEQLKEKRLAGGYPDVSGLDVYTTGFARTEQTLQILFGDVHHKIRRSFREMDFGIFEGKSYYEIKDLPEYQAWISGDQMKERCPGGESGNMMMARLLRGLGPLLKKGRDALVVCHGGSIAMLFGRFFPDTGLNWYEIQPANGEGFLIEFDGARPVRWERFPSAKNTSK